MTLRGLGNVRIPDHDLLPDVCLMIHSSNETEPVCLHVDSTGCQYVFRPKLLQSQDVT
jgi:hypothetical protein